MTNVCLYIYLYIYLFIYLFIYILAGPASSKMKMSYLILKT